MYSVPVSDTFLGRSFVLPAQPRWPVLCTLPLLPPHQRTVTHDEWEAGDLVRDSDGARVVFIARHEDDSFFFAGKHVSLAPTIGLDVFRDRLVEYALLLLEVVRKDCDPSRLDSCWYTTRHRLPCAWFFAAFMPPAMMPRWLQGERVLCQWTAARIGDAWVAQTTSEAECADDRQWHAVVGRGTCLKAWQLAEAIPQRHVMALSNRAALMRDRAADERFLGMAKSLTRALEDSHFQVEGFAHATFQRPLLVMPRAVPHADRWYVPRDYLERRNRAATAGPVVDIEDMPPCMRTAVHAVQANGLMRAPARHALSDWFVALAPHGDVAALAAHSFGPAARIDRERAGQFHDALRAKTARTAQYQLVGCKYVLEHPADLACPYAAAAAGADNTSRACREQCSRALAPNETWVLQNPLDYLLWRKHC